MMNATNNNLMMTNIDLVTRNNDYKMTYLNSKTWNSQMKYRTFNQLFGNFIPLFGNSLQLFSILELCPTYNAIAVRQL